MSEQPAGQDTNVLLNRIVVESILDEDGDPACMVKYTPDIRITDALGMLEYAKVQLIRQYERGDD